MITQIPEKARTKVPAILQLRKDGKSLRHITEETQLSRAIVVNALKSNGMTVRKKKRAGGVAEVDPYTCEEGHYVKFKPCQICIAERAAESKRGVL